MNIWLIQTGEILPLREDQRKMRIAFLADRLAERGHDVVWWTSAFDHFTKSWLFPTDTLFELKSGIRIQALKGGGYKKKISLARFIDHRRLTRKFRKIAPELARPDLVLASTPPYDLAAAVVSFARSRNIPVIVDIRDEWPDLFLTVGPARFRIFFKVLLTREYALLRKALSGADALTAVIQQLLDWGLKYAGRPKSDRDRVFYLGQQRLLADTGEGGCEFASRLKDKFVVSFLGTITRSNNPSILLDVAEKLKTDDRLLFVIAGDGELRSELLARANDLPNVLLPGWLNPKETSCLLANSHLGICSTTQSRNAFPNKAFTYLSAGLPVILSFRGDLKDLAEKHQFGFYYEPNDVSALADHIERLSRDIALRATMSFNARRTFDCYFDADIIYNNFAEYLESFLGPRSQAEPRQNDSLRSHSRREKHRPGSKKTARLK